MKRLFVNKSNTLPVFWFVLVLILSLSVLFTVLWQLDKWNSETFGIIKQVNQEAEHARKMRDAIRLREIAIQRMLNASDVFDRDEEYIRYLSYGADFVKARELLSQSKMTPEIQELNIRVKNAANYSQPYHSKLIELIIHGSAPAEELHALVKEGAKVHKQLIFLLDRLVQLQVERHQKVIAGYEESHKKMGIISAFIYAINLIVAILVIRFSGRRV